MSGIAGIFLAAGRSLRVGGSDKCPRRLADTLAISAGGDPSRFEDRVRTELA